MTAALLSLMFVLVVFVVVAAVTGPPVIAGEAS